MPLADVSRLVSGAAGTPADQCADDTRVVTGNRLIQSQGGLGRSHM